METNEPTTEAAAADVHVQPSTDAPPTETPPADAHAQPSGDVHAAPSTDDAPPAASQYDFDSWTEDDETAAIASLVPDVRHIIVEKRFVGRFVDGTIVELPLTLSVDDIDELEAVTQSPVDQLKHLLTKIGGAAAAAEFTRHDITETTILASRYFTILQRVAKASIPE